MDSTLLFLLVMGFLLIVSVANGNIKWKPKFWRALAEQTGLTLKMNWFLLNPQLVGIYKDFPVSIENFTQHKPFYEFIVITIKVRNPKANEFAIADKDFPISIFDQTYYSLPNKLGQPALDKRFRTSGQIDEYAKPILTNTSVQNRLINLPKLHLQLRGKELRYKKVGLETDLAQMSTALSLLAFIASIIDQSN